MVFKHFRNLVVRKANAAACSQTISGNVPNLQEEQQQTEEIQNWETPIVTNPSFPVDHDEDSVSQPLVRGLKGERTQTSEFSSEISNALTIWPIISTIFLFPM